MNEEYMKDCEKYQKMCTNVRRNYRRGLISEHDVIKAFAQITACIFGGCSGIYRELCLQDFAPCFED